MLVRALDVLFILHADHEQNCGTTAMRAVGSAHADPYICVRRRRRRAVRPAATAAPTRPVVRMLTEIGSIENVPALIEVGEAGQGPAAWASATASTRTTTRGRRSSRRPRDEVFEVTGMNPLLDIALKLEEVALDDDYFISRKLYPNVDFYSGLIYQAMGFPVEMFTVLFAIPARAGWLAHWVELLGDKGPEDLAAPRRPHIGPPLRATHVAVDGAVLPTARAHCAARLSSTDAGARRGAIAVACGDVDIEQDLADVRARLHVAVRADDLVDREAPVDHRLQQALDRRAATSRSELPADRCLSSRRTRSTVPTRRARL